MSNFISKFVKFINQNQSHQGRIGYYFLSDWYNGLSKAERELLNWANNQGWNTSKNTLISGNYSSSQTMGSWLNIMASNIRSTNVNFTIKILNKALESKDCIDNYFTYGELSECFYRSREIEKAQQYAEMQLNWYRNNENRQKLKENLKDLPRSIKGLGVIINILSKNKRQDAILKLVNEFDELLDHNHTYKYVLKG